MLWVLKIMSELLSNTHFICSSVSTHSILRSETRISNITNPCKYQFVKTTWPLLGEPCHQKTCHVIRKPAFYTSETRVTDWLQDNHGKHTAYWLLCYIDKTIPLLSKSEISSPLPFSVVVQLGLCQTWSKTPKSDFSQHSSGHGTGRYS